MSRRAWWMAVAVAVMLVAAGCGGSSSSNSTRKAGGSSSAQTSGSADLKGKPFELLCMACSADLVNGLNATFLPDFAHQTGMKIEPVDTTCCGIDKLQAEVNNHNVQWDVINFDDVTDYLLAKKAGLLAPIDTSIVPVNKLRKGTYDQYHYDEYGFAAVLGWNTKAFPGANHPTTLEDLFNTSKYPGKRCMFKSYYFGGTLEAALLADGVPANQLYPIDMNKALAKLDTIKNDIVWWTAGSQAAQFLANGTCKLGVIWNGVAQTAIRNGEPIDFTWNHAILTTSVNAIPKDTPNLKAAQLFMAAQINNTAAEQKLLGYTAYTLPLKQQTIPANVAKFAPEGPNRKNGIEEDDVYYTENAAAINKRFNDWLVTGK